MLGSQENHKSWARSGSIIVDSLIIASAAALAFYQALTSISGNQYTGIGFQNNNLNLSDSIILLVIFFLGISRLVIDLRSRELIDARL